MTKKYYFVTTLLAPLKIGLKPEIDSRELAFFLKMNLDPESFEKVSVLRRLVDIENIRHLLNQEPIETGGNFETKELEENLLNQEGLPAYIFKFFEKYETTELQLKNFPELLRAYFSNEIEASEGFVHTYLTFERNWRLVCTILRARDLKRNLETLLANEDPSNPLIEDALQQKDNATYLPPNSFYPLKLLFRANQQSPMDLNRAISQWRFDAIEEMGGWHTFDIDRILSYIVQLEIVEKWLKLDTQKGFKFIEKVVVGA